MIENLVSSYDGTSYSNSENIRRIEEIVNKEYGLNRVYDHLSLDNMIDFTGLFLRMQRECRYVPHYISTPLRSMEPLEIVEFMLVNISSQSLLVIGCSEISYQMGNRWVEYTVESNAYVNDCLKGIISIMDRYPMNLDIQCEACEAFITLLSLRSLHGVITGECKRVVLNAKNNHHDDRLSEVVNKLKVLW